MRDDAIKFIEAVGEWFGDPMDVDKQTANRLASTLSSIETSSLPSGPFGVAMLEVTQLAYTWRWAERDGMNDHALFDWLKGKDLAGILARLVEHGDGIATPRNTVTRDELVNRGKTKGLLRISTSRLSQWLRDDGFPRPIEKIGNWENYSVAQVNEWLVNRGDTPIKV